MEPLSPRHVVPGHWWLVAGLLLSAIPSLGAPTEPSRETKIKAVYLFNFAQYVSWPPEAFETPTSPLVIGVLGEDYLGTTLDVVVQEEVVHDRPLVVRRFRRVEEITTCHILFISRSESSDMGRILDHLRGRSILTVSDAARFASQGGVIHIVTENNKIRLLVNVKGATAAHLSISSKLLRFAEIIEPGKKR